MKNTKLVLGLGLALSLAACGGTSTDTNATVDPMVAPLKAPVSASQTIPGSYIVVLKEGVEPRGLAQAAGVVPTFVYSIVNGFAGQLNEGQLNALRRNPNVEYIEQDQVYKADATQYMDGAGDPWGLDRINQRDLPLDGAYTYTYTGDGVRAYIIDTGLDAGHADFEGRAQNVYDAFGGNGNDCNGHGTHVGGTVGGKTYGVAKKSLLRGVKVLDCAGSGSTSGIIAAVDWVRTNHIKPAVANMSLGGGKSSTLNTAVVNLSNAGVYVAVAAGNENQDACNVSPASAGLNTAVTTVAASDKTDTKASFSNFGGCVDIYAPGVGIKSAWIGSGTTETNTISGTSMASPHVAGVGALVKHRYGDISSASVWNYIYNAATPSKIKSNPSGTPNLLLYKYVTAW
ncbi:S8 family peptidase [Deinococcus peraridilitoris]|uniref:Subtilisin-like serine protease n=1 Tax=Deinococcus peraridilitoris (strain DSM 19664 / LMG 22246 / CIP 109416 / KR-200) TaxID=937777 RepID=L0A4B6_DEIPD|nr:S8 family peptidase [Deinococcus peraridilitoris]AFZ68274.1 subtilisin-like serine protease [Deinococcus peraridilitoris DSM 19664]